MCADAFSVMLPFLETGSIVRLRQSSRSLNTAVGRSAVGQGMAIFRENMVSAANLHLPYPAGHLAVWRTSTGLAALANGVVDIQELRLLDSFDQIFMQMNDLRTHGLSRAWILWWITRRRKDYAVAAFALRSPLLRLDMFIDRRIRLTDVADVLSDHCLALVLSGWITVEELFRLRNARWSCSIGDDSLCSALTMLLDTGIPGTGVGRACPPPALIQCAKVLQPFTEECLTLLCTRPESMMEWLILLLQEAESSVEEGSPMATLASCYARGTWRSQAYRLCR